MVKIYRLINDTWTISKKTLNGFEEKAIEPLKSITKFGVAFPNVYYMFRLRDTFIMELFVYASNVTANVLVSIKNTNIKHTFKNVTSGSDSFHLPHNILNPAKKNITNGNVEIEINGMFIIERDEYPVIRRMNVLSDESWKNKEKDFDIIVATGKNDDKERKVQIHKEVLIIQSPVFEAMFRSGREEAKTCTLKIPDFTLKTVMLAVDFFYGHEIPNSLSFEDVFELYRFADKYCVDNLINYLLLFISSRLSPSNVFEILCHSKVPYFDEKLKKLCYDFLDLCSELSIHIDETI